MTNYEAEANITSAVRDFLIATKLAKSEEIVEEDPPSEGSRRAVDLSALDTLIEFKRRIGSARACFEPNPEYVKQLDDYLAESQERGGVRMGILTDGKHWLLRWPNAGPVKLVRPYAFTFDDAERWFPCCMSGCATTRSLPRRTSYPDRESMAKHFGPDSPHYERDIAAFAALYAEYSDAATIRVKRELWEKLLTAALGEIAFGRDEMDDLFVRHTYLTAVVGMVVQASFGIDILAMAENDPEDLLYGRDFRSKTGLQGVVESDFFAWPGEVGGRPLLRTLARRVARFDWSRSPNDIAAILYETVIPPEERRQLGEYYTPAWLARAIVRELVTEPLGQYVLDPACGSGTFVAEAVAHLIDAASETSLDAKETLEWLRFSVTGIDVHPVAVHLARTAWVLAAQPAIQDAVEAGFASSVTVPVYLGDALQLRFRTGDMFSEREVTLQVEDDENTELAFPRRLVERAEEFDALMGDVADSIERGVDPHLALDDHRVTDPAERGILEKTVAALRRLHDEGRDHIWAYYTRNLVRPVALSHSKVDVIVGNPPWLNYNKTVSTLRSALERHSRHTYGIWAGGRYATHQDVAGLFFARSVDLYLKKGGAIGFVMPHSALQAGQYSKWRTGAWRGKSSNGLRTLSVDFGHETAWDLERLKPNDFFPVPASVVFAKYEGEVGEAKPLSGKIVRWLGEAGAADVRRESVGITDTSEEGTSAYDGHSRLGAILYPRCLIFVEEAENPAAVQAGGTVTVNPRRGSQDKRPWRDLELTSISGQTVGKAHFFDVHLGETVAPYTTLDPLKAVLPFKLGDDTIPTDPDGVGGIDLGALGQRMRARWRTVSDLWEDNKSSVNKLDLIGQLDFWGHLSAQLKWRHDSGDRPVRVVYTKSGVPTATLLQDDDAILDHKLFWIACRDAREANYLLAIINSEVLYAEVSSLMPKGQFGARDLQKHLWKLPIPEFDAGDDLHVEVSEAGESAARGAAERLASLREERDRVTVTIARRELRAWLRASDEGRAVEAAVGRLLG